MTILQKVNEALYEKGCTDAEVRQYLNGDDTDELLNYIRGYWSQSFGELELIQALNEWIEWDWD